MVSKKVLTVTEGSLRSILSELNENMITLAGGLASTGEQSIIKDSPTVNAFKSELTSSFGGSTAKNC